MEKPGIGIDFLSISEQTSQISDQASGKPGIGIIGILSIFQVNYHHSNNSIWINWNWNDENSPGKKKTEKMRLL